jgi:hypothetical protein
MGATRPFRSSVRFGLRPNLNVYFCQLRIFGGTNFGGTNCLGGEFLGDELFGGRIFWGTNFWGTNCLGYEFFGGRIFGGQPRCARSNIAALGAGPRRCARSYLPFFKKCDIRKDGRTDGRTEGRNCDRLQL